MTEFKTIALSEIHADKNQPRKFFDDHALKELTESVKLKGVLQPVMIRPNGKGYVLVCGERRLKASTAAGLKEIPAVIRNLTDEEALEIQFIENIQREDVHPMDEASTFKQMLENKVHPYTVGDIAAKINKPEKYVTHRLSLNNLIPELQKEFWNGKFLIGHAVLFSKLALEDQKVCLKECKDWNKEFKPISTVKEFISRNVMRVLSSAPFKKDDATLNPEMGPCTTCPFRSGNNPTLFDEVKETDRCFKPSCFTLKTENWTIKKLEEILVEQPDFKLLYNANYKFLKAIDVLAKQYKVTMLREYHDFSTYANSGRIKMKGIWVNGSDLGKIQDVYVESNSKVTKQEKTTDGKPTNSAIDAEITGIKERTKRAAELDDEKVWKRIHEEIVWDKQLINTKKLSNIDTAAVLYAMSKNVGYSHSDKFRKIFGGGIDKQFAEKLLTATPDQFNEASRLFFTAFLDNLQGSHTSSASLYLLKTVAEQYKKDEIMAIELEQKEKRVKREERAAVRIKALQAQKKVKAEPAAKKAAPAPVKKGKGIKALLK